MQGPVPGNYIFEAVRDTEAIVMAANARIALVIPGILRAAKDLDSAVILELAKSECDLDGGYTAFGRVASGMDVVDRIQPGDVIERVEIWDGTR